jgi:hypothetical protein
MRFIAAALTPVLLGVSGAFTSGNRGPDRNNLSEAVFLLKWLS